MRLTDEQQTSVDDALYPKMQPVTDYSADPGLGVYSPSTTQPSPDANNDGLNDSTGWAMGVQQDQSSPTGFSYNGQPTQSNGALYTAPQYGPSVQQDNAYQQSQNQYLGDSPNSGVYQDPGGNVWENGNWWNQNGEVWNDQANSWLSPAQYNDFAQQSYDYGNAQANPQFQPNTYQQPSWWYNYDQQPALNNAPFQDPGYESPWNPDYMKNQGGGGFWGGVKDFVQPGIDAFTNSPIVAAPIIAGNAASGLLDQWTGTSRQQRINDQLSGNALINDVTGYDPSTLPYGLGYVTDAAAPVNFLGIGSTGVIGKEVAAGVLGNIGAGLAGSDAASNIPVFGAQPKILRQLEGGLAGGAIGYKAAPEFGNAGETVANAGTKAGSLLSGGESGSTPPISGKTIPGMFDISPGAAEAGVRPGTLLKPRGIDQLGDYTVNDAIQVAKDLERQRGSVANTLMAESDGAWRALGKTVKDADGNVYFKDIAPSAAETQAGLSGALATRVIERPGEYLLTPAQSRAVTIIGNIEKKVAAERDAFGAPIDRLSMQDGEQYMHRVAVKPSTATQVDALLNDGANNVSLQGGGAGRRLGGAADKSRLYEDPLQAVQDGVVYADPKQALKESIDANLKKAADAHVKSLLTPFAETASDRVPEALRAEVTNAKNIAQRIEGRLATAERRAGIKTSEGDNLATMFEKSATGARLATDAPTQDIATVNKFISTAQKRIFALRQKGGAYEDTARTLQGMLDDARLRVADVMPQWEQAKELSRNIPPGRAPIRQDLAPALIGSDFKRADAARINAYLSRGIRVGDRVMNTNIPGVKVLNSVIVPINAIGDASSTLNQLAMAGASHPIQFAKNFGKVLKDSLPFGDEGYYKWESSPSVKEAASHGVSILGDSGARADFQLGTWVEKIPVLSQTQKHFTRFGNRMRVDAYEAAIKSAEAKGPVDDLFKEQTARAVDRLTGVSTSRATDAETLASFAPNWLRSNIENVVKAAADGSIEGQLARQYMKNYIALGSVLVTGAALAQNRDLSEVLAPLDAKALKRGEVRLNPNFMTVRVAGQDINVFGAYDSLARLATLGVDSTQRALREKDAKQLFDFVGYAAQTKGSPLVKLGAELIKGETFSGEDPLALGSLAKRALPFTVNNAIENYQSGMPNKQNAIDTGLGFFGAKSNPMSYSEKRAQAIGPNPTEKQLFDYNQQNGRSYSTDPTIKAQQVKADAIHEMQDARQQARDTELNTNGMTPDNWRIWRDQRKQDNLYFAGRFDELYSGVNFKDTNVTDVDRYYKAIADNTDKVTGDINWDAVDAATKGLDQAYIKDNTNLRDSTVEKTYHANVDAIEKTGYFDRTDQNWAQVAKLVPTSVLNVNPKDYQSYDEWRAAALQAGLKLAGKTPSDVGTVTEIESWLDKQDPAKGMEYFGSQWRDEWTAKNPKEAYLAWQMGYYNPKKEIKAWLTSKFE